MKFQVIGPAGMSVNQTPCSSVAIGQMPFSSTTQMPTAGEPSGWTIVPITRVLPGVIVGPGVGNGVVPGSGVTSGVASGTPTASDASGTGEGGTSVGLGEGDALGWTAAGVHAASARAATIAKTVRRILRWCDIW